MQTLALFGSLYFLYVANVIRRKGSRPALFFWSPIPSFIVRGDLCFEISTIEYNLFTLYFRNWFCHTNHLAFVRWQIK
ncbi:hypothetical protein CS542_07295 [Pedobacter sp. IW39]|nr:hypothetical protein CS542_07295 [Pedobacter sp. IW39]